MPDLASWLKEREIMQQLLHQNLLKAQNKMKQQADKHRTDRQFVVGDKVYLKFQPYIQTLLADRSNQILSFHYYGPYEVIERVGEVAYRLKLPPSSLIHPVIHISQLMRAVTPDMLVAKTLPSSISVLQQDHEPERVLQQKLVKRGKSLVPRVLVQWKGLPANMATWEDFRDVQRRFPASTT